MPGRTGVSGEKPLRAERKTNKLNPNITQVWESKPGYFGGRRVFLPQRYSISYISSTILTVSSVQRVTGHGATKPELKSSEKITVSNKLKNFCAVLLSVKQRISWVKILGL